MLTKFSITPSKHLLVLFLFGYIGGIACLLFSAAPVWLKLTGIAFCLASSRHLCCKYVLLSHPKSIIHCTAIDHVVWQLTYLDGTTETLHLFGDSWTSRWAMILNFQKQTPHLMKLKSTKLKSRPISLILSNDSLEKNAYRRLQVYLKLSANPNT